jgi:hypothetical protein
MIYKCTDTYQCYERDIDAETAEDAAEKYAEWHCTENADWPDEMLVIVAGEHWVVYVEHETTYSAIKEED